MKMAQNRTAKTELFCRLIRAFQHPEGSFYIRIDAREDFVEGAVITIPGVQDELYSCDGKGDWVLDQVVRHETLAALEVAEESPPVPGWDEGLGTDQPPPNVEPSETAVPSDPVPKEGVTEKPDNQAVPQAGTPLEADAPVDSGADAKVIPRTDCGCPHCPDDKRFWAKSMQGLGKHIAAKHPDEYEGWKATK